jgi:hypothetical protein
MIELTLGTIILFLYAKLDDGQGDAHCMVGVVWMTLIAEIPRRKSYRYFGDVTFRSTPELKLSDYPGDGRRALGIRSEVPAKLKLPHSATLAPMRPPNGPWNGVENPLEAMSLEVGHDCPSFRRIIKCGGCCDCVKRLQKKSIKIKKWQENIGL